MRKAEATIISLIIAGLFSLASMYIEKKFDVVDTIEITFDMNTTR